MRVPTGLFIMYFDLLATNLIHSYLLRQLCYVFPFTGTSDDPEETMRQAALCKEAGIHIYAIAVGLKVNDELMNMASAPWQQNVFTTKNFKALADLQTQLYELISDVCPRKTICYLHYHFRIQSNIVVRLYSAGLVSNVHWCEFIWESYKVGGYV